MNKFSSCLCATILMVAGALIPNHARAQEDFAGDWEGILKLTPAISATLQFSIKGDKDGTFSAILNSPDEQAGIHNIPAASVSVKNSTITMGFPNIGAQYQGTLADGEIKGEWRQAGQKFPLTLAARVSDDAAQVENARQATNAGQSVMIDMGGHKLKVKVAGTAQAGVPAVVFSSGLGSPLQLWSGLPSVIAKSTKTVAYDRAGIGASEIGQEAPTLEHIVNELHELLVRLEVPPPYVLVGHSLGGAIDNMFAAKYPDEVAGLVYIDPADFMQTDADLDAIWDEVGVPNGRELDRKAGEDTLAKAPPGVVAEANEFRKAEKGGFAAYRKEGMAPDVPTVVLLAGTPPPQQPNADSPIDYSLVFKVTLKQRLAHFGALVNRTTNGTLLLTSMSGHYIHQTQPELAEWAVKQVLAAATANPQLDRFVGKYQVEPGYVFTISRQGDTLYSDLTGQPRLPIQADSTTNFSFQTIDARMDFELDDAGDVKGLMFHQNGFDIPAEKMD